MDVLAALRWIQANAKSFGGDPAKVTVMGQSAGAAAIDALLQSPLSKGLFRAAIIDSGVQTGSRLAANEAHEKVSAEWAASHGAISLAQLRALPAEALVPVRGQNFRFGPSIDGHVIPASGANVMDVPVLTGWNAGEGSVGGGRLLTTPVPRTEFEKQNRSRWGIANEISALYPSGEDARDVARQSGHDALMMSSAAWAAGRKSPVYYYDFEHVMPGAEAAPYGSYHSSELPYALDTLHTLNRPWTEADYKVSALTQAYWVNFIKSGNPNGGALPNWTRFDPAANEVMALGAAPRMRPITEPGRAQAWLRAIAR